jgi:hypothetical protein
MPSYQKMLVMVRPRPDAHMLACQSFYLSIEFPSANCPSYREVRRIRSAAEDIPSPMPRSMMRVRLNICANVVSFVLVGRNFHGREPGISREELAAIDRPKATRTPVMGLMAILNVLFCSWTRSRSFGGVVRSLVRWMEVELLLVRQLLRDGNDLIRGCSQRHISHLG